MKCVYKQKNARKYIGMNDKFMILKIQEKEGDRITKRENFIDYAKAICIILVVFVHVGYSNLNDFILFAIPVFFAASGYTFDFKGRSFRQNVSRRFSSVMLPFWALMLFYTALEVVRAILFGYGTVLISLPSFINAVYGSGVVPYDNGFMEKIKEIMSYKAQPAYGTDLILPLNCHLWFLPAMFTGYVMFLAFVKKVQKNHLLKLTAIVFLILLAASESIFPEIRQFPYGIGRGAMGAAFMLVGFWIKKYRLLEGKNAVYMCLTNFFALIIFIFSLLIGSNGSAFVRSDYGPHGILSVFATFFGGVCGIWLIFSICMMLDYIKIDKIKIFLSFLGKNVIFVYSWHMAYKFLLDVFYICVLNGSNTLLLDDYKMGLMPQNSMCFMLLEVIMIVALCSISCKFKNSKRFKKDIT